MKNGGATEVAPPHPSFRRHVPDFDPGCGRYNVKKNVLRQAEEMKNRKPSVRKPVRVSCQRGVAESVVFLTH